MIVKEENNGQIEGINTFFFIHILKYLKILTLSQ